MPTQDEIKQFFLSNPSPSEIAAARAAHPEVTNEQIASAMQVGTDDVSRVLKPTGALPTSNSSGTTQISSGTTQMGGDYPAQNPGETIQQYAQRVFAMQGGMSDGPWSSLMSNMSRTNPELRAQMSAAVGQPITTVGTSGATPPPPTGGGALSSSRGQNQGQNAITADQIKQFFATNPTPQ